jgi:hypothetical protein
VHPIWVWCPPQVQYGGHILNEEGAEVIHSLRRLMQTQCTMLGFPLPQIVPFLWVCDLPGQWWDWGESVQNRKERRKLHIQLRHSGGCQCAGFPGSPGENSCKFQPAVSQPSLRGVLSLLKVS